MSKLEMIVRSVLLCLVFIGMYFALQHMAGPV